MANHTASDVQLVMAVTALVSQAVHVRRNKSTGTYRDREASANVCWNTFALGWVQKVHVAPVPKLRPITNAPYQIHVAVCHRNTRS